MDNPKYNLLLCDEIINVNNKEKKKRKQTKCNGSLVFRKSKLKEYFSRIQNSNTYSYFFIILTKQVHFN